jgi:hypothetical protein
MALLGLEQAREQHRIECHRRAVGAAGLVGEARGPEGLVAARNL